MIGRAARLLRAARGRSAHELSTRAAQLIAARAESSHLGAMLDLTSATPERAVRRGEPRDPGALLARFRARAGAGFFAGPADPAATARLVRARAPEHAAETVAFAERVLAGRFDLLGYQGLDFGKPVDWHCDPVARKRAPLVPWSRVPYLDRKKVGDHKVVWELNRMQWLVPLGQAYAYTGDERYARAFAEHTSAWIAANPPKLGINWASSLEVAFRAMSWLWALHLFRGSPALTPALYARVVGVLHVHGRHLETYLSTYFSPNTHLTGEALGLVHLGLLLPELRCAARWRRRGVAVLEAELARHVRPDGVYFEQASQYHRYTTEFYLHLLLLAGLHGETLGAPVRERVDALFEHLLHLARPDGTIPLIGDDDGGRLVQLDRRPPDDVRALLAAGAATLDRADLALGARGDVGAMAWLLGAEGLARFDGLRPEAPAALARAFPDGGVYVVRDGWGADAAWLALDCGPHGAMTAGHAHADALSLELAVRGRPTLVDAGTYTYVGTERNAFRGTAAHNAVTVDGQSSSEPAEAPFRWRRTATCVTERWIAEPRFTAFAGRHDGFAALPEPAAYRRELLALAGDYWVVRDVVESEGEHEVAVHWHAAPALAARILPGVADAAKRGVADLVDADDRPCLRLVTVSDGHGSVAIEDGWVSPAYGRREHGTTLVYRQRAAGRQEIVTCLLPGRWGAAVRPARDLGRGLGLTIAHEGLVDWLLLGHGDVMVREDVRADAAWLWLRRRADGTPVEYVALDVGELVVAGREIVAGGERRPWSAGRLDADGPDGTTDHGRRGVS